MLAISDQRVGIEIQIHVSIRFVASKLPAMKSNTQLKATCRISKMKFWRQKFRRYPQKKHPKIFAFAIPCGFGSWFLLRIPPGVGLVKASAFLRGVTAVPGAIFWSKITIPRTEAENIRISGLPKPCDSSIYEGNPIVCMIVWVSTLFTFMKGTLLTFTDAEAVFSLGGQIEIFFPWKVFWIHKSGSFQGFGSNMIELL